VDRGEIEKYHQADDESMTLGSVLLTYQGKNIHTFITDIHQSNYTNQSN